ncbi:MAG: cobalamin-binding protein [Candidatus Omnitrophota bacterium]
MLTRWSNIPTTHMKKFILSACLLLVTSLPLFAAEGTRYISLAPSTTEILFALGLDDEIIGVSSFCNYPPKAKAKEKIGDFSSPNIEKILALKPDYIFCTGLEQTPAIESLKRYGLPVYVADPKNIQELLESIKQIGELTKRNTQAQQVIVAMQDEITKITQQAQRIPADKRLKIFIEIWFEPLTTAGKGSFIDELITLAGGINIAKNTLRPYSIFSPEEVIKQNPDCIFLTYMNEEKPIELVKKRFGWQQINAVRNNRIYNDIQPDILLRPGPRITKGLKLLFEKLYVSAHEY